MKQMRRGVVYYLRKDALLYLLLLPAVGLTLVFAYFPMPWMLMAFQDYNVFKGLLGSPWVGLQNIQRIFTMPMFSNAVVNTLTISVLQLLVGFPAPIILALLINEIRNSAFKRVTQTISYLPHFLSWISVVGLVYAIFGSTGIINDLRISILGPAAGRTNFLAEQRYFVPFVVGLTVWKEVGWGTIVHLASIISINPELYEAAEVDGASHFKQVRHITLPHMIPTIFILLIFKLGTLFSSNFDLIYGLQNPFIDFEVISTIVYYTGIQQGNYSMATAVGFMEGLIALLLTMTANKISKKVSSVGIW